MKKSVLLFGIAVATSVIVASCGESEAKKEIRQEVRMENENGEKTLTVKTEIDGNKTEDVYTGKQAEKKLKEIEASTKEK